MFLHWCCFHPCQRHGLSLAAARRLLGLRLALVEFCLSMLEERCAEETLQALACEKMTLAEIALEEYSRCTPEPNSKEEVRLQTL